MVRRFQKENKTKSSFHNHKANVNQPTNKFMSSKYIQMDYGNELKDTMTKNSKSHPFSPKVEK